MEELEISEVVKKIDEAVKKPDSPGVILNECLKIIVESLGAERGAILLYDSNFDELNAMAVHNLDSETFFSSAEVSISVIDKVYKEHVSLMSYDAVSDPRFSDKLSVLVSALRSFLCVPMTTAKGLLGIIYVDDRSRAKAYANEHLSFLENCSKKLSEVIAEFYPNLEPKPKG